MLVAALGCTRLYKQSAGVSLIYTTQTQPEAKQWLHVACYHTHQLKKLFKLCEKIFVPIISQWYESSLTSCVRESYPAATAAGAKPNPTRSQSATHTIQWYRQTIRSHNNESCLPILTNLCNVCPQSHSALTFNDSYLTVQRNLSSKECYTFKRPEEYRTVNSTSILRFHKFLCLLMLQHRYRTFVH